MAARGPDGVAGADDARVLAVIDAMAAGQVDLVVFTSSPQLRRLRQVAAAAGRDLALALGRARIAAVGPLVAEAVVKEGGVVAVMPESSFHMKPMVTAIIAALHSGE